MNDPVNLHLAFNGKTLDYIVNVLAQRPYAECAGVLADISAQVSQQQAQKSPLVGGVPLPDLGEPAPSAAH